MNPESEILLNIVKNKQPVSCIGNHLPTEQNEKSPQEVKEALLRFLVKDAVWELLTRGRESKKMDIGSAAWHDLVTESTNTVVELIQEIGNNDGQIYAINSKE